MSLQISVISCLNIWWIFETLALLWRFLRCLCRVFAETTTVSIYCIFTMQHEAQTPRRGHRGAMAFPHIVRPVEEITAEELNNICGSARDKVYNRAMVSIFPLCEMHTLWSHFLVIPCLLLASSRADFFSLRGTLWFWGEVWLRYWNVISYLSLNL